MVSGQVHREVKLVDRRRLVDHTFFKTSIRDPDAHADFGLRLRPVGDEQWKLRPEARRQARAVAKRRVAISLLKKYPLRILVAASVSVRRRAHPDADRHLGK